MGHWAAEWVFADPTEDECDGLSLLWRMHQHAVPAKLPDSRTVVHVVLTGTSAAEGWLDIDSRGVTVCADDPGIDCDLAVEAVTGDMQRWLVGLVPFRQLLVDGSVRLLGPSRLARAFPTWFDTTFFDEGLRRRKQRRTTEATQQALGKGA